MKHIGACATRRKGGAREDYKSSIQVDACTKKDYKLIFGIR